ncbi:SEC-C metal-binding domain-containing protein [Paenibacillus sp. NPDC058174]|uniref:SEC-C metal-binding domain-containing protein n=1 Tax=Paenibacillus sp. NPDC058174 TaxID=3346366 RepID=UPI0036DBC074
MKKLGRNDPCHCGSGLKYKKCCIDKDEAGNVIPLTSSQPAVPKAAAKSIWLNEQHELIADHFVHQTKQLYSQEEITRLLRIWNDYARTTDPISKKIGVYPAALEYILCQIHGYEVTQSALAKKYEVSVGTLSQRVNQIYDYLDEVTPADLEPVHQNSKMVPNASVQMEKDLLNIQTLLQEQNFETIEEANDFLQRNLNQIPARTKEVSKTEQAADLIYAAWEEPTPQRRVKLAQDALLLDPNNVDAYNLLAESAATKPKEAAYFYKQAMTIAEKDFGEAFFKEYKGHFWMYMPTRPYMRAKKGYAEVCVELDKLPEAIQHYREMLELNPMDNQGVRELLLSAYIETMDWNSADKLIQQYEEDHSAAFNYSRILVEHALNGKSSKLNKLIKDATAHNPYVPPYLLGKKRMPRQAPEYIGYGDDREAVVYVALNHHLWLTRPELLQLLPAGRK